MLAACAPARPRLPYPAFIKVDERPDVFIAGLPGVRAKQLAGDPRTQRGSYRVVMPPQWQFTTGASPAHSVEIFVLAGVVELGEFALNAGGYAYIPPGSTGLQLRTATGAMMLYFVDDANVAAVIQTPLIANSSLLDWQIRDVGLSLKELRGDPGSGARTWLLRVAPGVTQPYRRSSRLVEGYLVSGAYTESECSGAEVVTADYLPGGYFARPPGAIHGGPAAGTSAGATWLLRVQAADQEEVVDSCVP
jgi:hypothetical protein